MNKVNLAWERLSFLQRAVCNFTGDFKGGT